MRIKSVAVGLFAAAALFAATAGPARADIAYEPCPGVPVFSWSGASTVEQVSIPSQTTPNGITAFNGAMWRPTGTAAYPGKRPVVLLQHGLGGNLCALSWVARYLAGHGYIAVTWTSPQGSDNSQSFINGLDAMRSALIWIRTAANPELAISDTTRMTVGGGSMGSIITSYVQGDGDPGVKAALAFDNLRHWLSGDPGAAAGECAGSPTVAVKPTVPALGFAKDSPCNALPNVTTPDIKQAGFQWWKQNGVPSMVLAMAGYDHGDLVSNGATEQQKLQVIHYVDAWLRLWIEGDKSATDDLLATTVAGVPTTSFLSTNYLSGAYLPPDVDTDDFRTWLGSDRVAPKTKRVAGPGKRVDGGVARRKGVKFRFRADETAKFECKLDKAGWKHCKSPKVVKHLDVGKHRFRVRATDGAGNRGDSKSWKFRVVR